MSEKQHIQNNPVGSYIQLNVEPATPPVAKVVKSYEQQLSVARHLAGFKARARIKEALLTGDEETRRRLEYGLDSVDPNPARKRGDYVKRAAEALFLSLIFTGDDNPIIDDVRKELSKAINKDVEFIYPPGGRMRLMVRENDKTRTLTDEEQLLLVPVLKQITSQHVDTIMHGKSANHKPE